MVVLASIVVTTKIGNDKLYTHYVISGDMGQDLSVTQFSTSVSDNWVGVTHFITSSGNGYGRN